MHEYESGERVFVDPVGAAEFVGVVQSVDRRKGIVVVDAPDEPELSGAYPIEAVSHLAA
jgi:hypothetical protein